MKNYLFVIFVFISSVSINYAGPADPVVFDDENLEAMVQNELNVAEPNQSDMLNLTFLDASSSGIHYLGGLEYATNLVSLHLNNNSISDLSPIASLVSLEYLHLNANLIDDLTHLADLVNLEYLELNDNNIVNVDSLWGMTDLYRLYLSNNNISNLYPLANLTRMRFLTLQNNDIRDLTPLASMPILSDLVLRSNDISDITPLAANTRLGLLDAASNNISDISVLSSLVDIQKLDLTDNDVSDVTPLTNIPYMRYLFLNNNQISDVSSFIVFRHLEDLRLLNNPLDDLSHLFWTSRISRLSRCYVTTSGYTGSTKIVIANPNQRTTHYGTQIMPIEWGSFDTSPLVDISYSLDNGVTWEYIATVPNRNDYDNSYIWALPQAYYQSGQYLVKVTDHADAAKTDTSDDYFRLKACDINHTQGDLNNDCRVDLSDVVVIAQNWLLRGDTDYVENFFSFDYDSLDPDLWQFNGPAWTRTTDQTFEGSHSVTSPALLDNESSSIELTYRCGSDKRISFNYKVSSEENYDKLIFYIDQVEVASYSGDTDWQQAVFTFTSEWSSWHDFEWKYEKDGSRSSGEDKVWIDSIEIY